MRISRVGRRHLFPPKELSSQTNAQPKRPLPPLFLPLVLTLEKNQKSPLEEKGKVNITEKVEYGGKRTESYCHIGGMGKGKKRRHEGYVALLENYFGSHAWSHQYCLAKCCAGLKIVLPIGQLFRCFHDDKNVLLGFLRRGWIFGCEDKKVDVQFNIPGALHLSKIYGCS